MRRIVSDYYIKKFWERVKGSKATECWLWSGRRSKAGYGQLKIAGKPLAAHRVSYAIHKGDIANGMLVCHTCDTPPCVNPDHLFLGTPLDNTRDMWRKGRSAHQKIGWEFSDKDAASRIGKDLIERPFTKRQIEIIGLVALGKTNEQIAAEIGRSIKTVDKHRQAVLKKLEASGVAPIVHFALSRGIVKNIFDL